MKCATAAIKIDGFSHGPAKALNQCAGFHFRPLCFHSWDLSHLFDCSNDLCTPKFFCVYVCVLTSFCRPPCSYSCYAATQFASVSQYKKSPKQRRPGTRGFVLRPLTADLDSEFHRCQVKQALGGCRDGRCCFTPCGMFPSASPQHAVTPFCRFLPPTWDHPRFNSQEYRNSILQQGASPRGGGRNQVTSEKCGGSGFPWISLILEGLHLYHTLLPNREAHYRIASSQNAWAPTKGMHICNFCYNNYGVHGFWVVFFFLFFSNGSLFSWGCRVE